MIWPNPFTVPRILPIARRVQPSRCNGAVICTKIKIRALCVEPPTNFPKAIGRDGRNKWHIEDVSRIGRAFERRFRQLLAEAGTRQSDKGIRWLFARADDRARNDHTTTSHALAEMNIALAEKLHRLRKRRGVAAPLGCLAFCDAGLGGLARWLRASGCDALWVQDISDADLVARAEEINAIIITTDSFLLDRRRIAHGRVRAVWFRRH